MAVLQSQPSSVAFIGLGAMGFAMSQHLLKQGVPVIGFDVWKPTLERFQVAYKSILDAKGSIATSPAEAASSSPIILLMVANHHHVNSALFDPEVGAIKTIPPSATIIVCSTVPPTHPSEVRHRLDTEFSRPDIKLIDAPVSGGVVGSSSGTLTIMASSDDPSALSDPHVSSILNHLSHHGQRLYHIPGGLGAGTSAKALNQVMCGTHIVGASEIMALAALNNLNTSHFYQTMKSPDPTRPHSRRHGWTWMFENRGPRMLDASLPIASATAIIMKDVGIIKDEETRLGIHLPQLNKVHATLTRCMDSDMGPLDDALVNQWYLGLQTPRHDLAMKLADPNNPVLPGDQPAKTQTLLLAHSLVNFMSAYETVVFAQALDLMAEEQRRMWFDIIAGAAGGSTVFGEVIPVVFAKMPDWEAGFREYARGVFGGRDLGVVEEVVKHAREHGVEPVLVETALAFTRSQLT